MQAPALRIGLLPGAAVAGLLGGIFITNAVSRISHPRQRKTLFVRRRPQRRCPRCAGFGISRCTLCRGEAICSYRLRFTRELPCPLCVMRRYIPCGMCNGSGIRPPTSSYSMHFDVALLSLRRYLDYMSGTLFVPVIHLITPFTSHGTWRLRQSKKVTYLKNHRVGSVA